MSIRIAIAQALAGLAISALVPCDVAQATTIRELNNFSVPGKIASVSCTAEGCPEYMWLNTGLLVEEGDWLLVEATGGVSFCNGCPGDGPDGQIGVPAQPHGGYYYVASDLNRYSLIGRIGAPNVSPDTRHRLGDPFDVGADLMMQSTQTGILYLSVNDSFFHDNGGQWVVNATVSTPEPSAVLLVATGFAALVYRRRAFA